MKKVLINEYSAYPQKKFGESKEETVKRGTDLFPLKYYLNNTVDPHYDLPIHWHSDFELIHIISGEYTFFVEGAEYILQKGDSCFIPGNILHGDGAKKGNALYESVVFSIDLIRQHSYLPDNFIGDILSGTIKLENVIPATNTEMKACIENLFDVLKVNPDGTELLASGYLLLLLGQYKKQHLFTTKNVISNLKKRQSEQMESVINYIRNNYNKDLSLDEMAEQANLSPKYFCRVFKDITGRSPVEYLNWFRINRACSRLRESSDKLNSIALDCGFNDFSYFIKIFKKYRKMTPLKYRNMGAVQETDSEQSSQESTP